MDHSEEIYKMKYLKYKFKYLQLKDELEGGTNPLGFAIAGLGYGLGKLAQQGIRTVKKISKTVTGKEDEEIKKINIIVKKYKLTDGVKKENGLYNVRSFLDKLQYMKREKNISEEKLADLNYVEGKHYMCKTTLGSTLGKDYDVKQCFE